MFGEARGKVLSINTLFTRKSCPPRLKIKKVDLISGMDGSYTSYLDISGSNGGKRRGIFLNIYKEGITFSMGRKGGGNCG